MDSSVPLMHHDPDRSWITDPDPGHPKGTQLKQLANPRQLQLIGLRSLNFLNDSPIICFQFKTPRRFAFNIHR